MMADSGARGSRAADPPARRHARPDGQAVGRDHRDADHLELPRGPHGAPVLHLDPRRAQGPRRHGAQDRQLGLPHPPPGRRRAGRDHQRGRLRHARRHRDRRRSSRAARSSSRSATASSAAWRSRTSSIRSPARCSCRPARRSTRIRSSIIEDAGIERVLIRSVLTCEARRGVCVQVLRARPRARRAW